MVSMDLSASTALLLTLSCCLWNTESQSYPRPFSSVLSVPNGGLWGQWGLVSICDYGFAKGFSLKVEREQPLGDNTGLNGIRLYCDDGSVIESKVGPWGKWTKNQFCHGGFLDSFSLRVEPNRGMLDDSAANNVWFNCTDGFALAGFGHTRGTFGPWSQHCAKHGICGLRTRVDDKQGLNDDTALNDVLFFCC